MYSDMTWAINGDSPDVWIGYVAGGAAVYSNLYSFTPQALRMDLHAVTNGKWVTFISLIYKMPICFGFVIDNTTYNLLFLQEKRKQLRNKVDKNK